MSDNGSALTLLLSSLSITWPAGGPTDAGSTTARRYFAPSGAVPTVSGLTEKVPEVPAPVPAATAWIVPGIGRAPSVPPITVSKVVPLAQYSAAVVETGTSLPLT